MTDATQRVITGRREDCPESDSKPNAARVSKSKSWVLGLSWRKKDGDGGDSRGASGAGCGEVSTVGMAGQYSQIAGAGQGSLRRWPGILV